MTATRASIIVVLLVVGGLAIAPVASTAFVGGFIDDTEASVDHNESTTNETTPGADVSTFMQASAADAGETVDAEMFIAAYENGDNETREQVVTERTTQLAAKLERLEDEHDELRERKDELNPAAYNAKMASLTVRIGSLERAINDTQPRAAKVGVDTAGLEELRANASTLSGPEVAEIARNISGIEPPRGPPDGVPGNENENGNGNGNGVGPNADTTDGNATDRGPGTNNGNGNGNGNNAPGGPPGSADSGNETDQNKAHGTEKDKRGQNEVNRGGGPPDHAGGNGANGETDTDAETESVSEQD